MATSAPTLGTIARRLKTGKLLHESDWERLVQEIQGLDIHKCVPEDKTVRAALFDSTNAESRFGALPSFEHDIARRRAMLDAWISGVLRPPYFENTECPLDEESSGSDMPADKGESPVETNTDENPPEGTEAMGILTEREETDLFLAYNYARHRIAGILPSDVSFSRSTLIKGNNLEELVRWTTFAADVRNLLVEFHYRFVVKIAHSIRRSINGNLSIREMFNAGVEGIKEAINAFDSSKGSARLIGFARLYVFGGIQKWFDKEETQWTATTKPTPQDALGHVVPGKGERERIHFEEIVAGQKIEGWSSVQEEGFQGSQTQAETLLGDTPLRQDALKLEHFVAISRIRKSASMAITEKDAIEVFKKSVKKSAIVVDSGLAGSADADFAPPEWQIVWLRRLIRRHKTNLRLLR